MYKKISALFILGLTYLSLAFPAFGQNIDPCPIGGTNFRKLCNYDLSTVGVVIRNGITILFIIATIASLFFLIYGGIKWITSGGDKAALETARNTIVAAAIGLVLTFLSFFIVNIVLNFFGLPNVWTFVIPTLG